MIRSRVTLATIDAAATDAVTASPFLMARCGRGMWPTGHPSVRTKSGRIASSRSTLRRRNLFERCNPRWSIRDGMARHTDTATAAAVIRA
jgi:hypothetical protein